MNDFISERDPRSRGHAINPVTQNVQLVPKVARDLKARGIKWCIVGDYNYGEGSSREHAALEPRHLGGVVVVARGFARIHETNLKKQGMLPLTFADPADYDKVQEGDTISLKGAQEGVMAPGKQVEMHVTTREGKVWTANLNHSYHTGQIRWLRAGSALNHIRSTAQQRSSW